MSSPAAQRAVERQRAATRQAILDAALTLMRERPLETFSHESVAGRAGVSVRTVYRHFPTRHDLSEGAWLRVREDTGTKWPGREDEIAPAVRRTFQQFEQFAALTRRSIAAAATASPARGSAEGRAAFRRSLFEILARLSDADGRALVAACVAIYSAPFWQMLRDRGQLPARRAEDAAVMAVEAVIAAARAKAAARGATRQI